MSQQKPPAGWYDDPAGGGGGRRYWDGQTWTERTQPAGGIGAARPDRLPDGHMMLNGRRVPIQGTSDPYASSSGLRPGTIALAVTVCVLIVVAGAVALASFGSAAPDEDGGSYAPLDESVLTLEVESDTGAGIEVTWHDGTGGAEESAVADGWSTDVSVVDGHTVLVRARATDVGSVTTCRILDSSGEVLVESTAAHEGGTAACEWQ